MSSLLYFYAIGGLVSIAVVLLCAIMVSAGYEEAIKTALIVGLIWPIAWPLCIYTIIKGMVIKGRNKKR